MAQRLPATASPVTWPQHCNLASALLTLELVLVTTATGLQNSMRKVVTSLLHCPNSDTVRAGMVRPACGLRIVAPGDAAGEDRAVSARHPWPRTQACCVQAADVWGSQAPHKGAQCSRSGGCGHPQSLFLPGGSQASSQERARVTQWPLAGSSLPGVLTPSLHGAPRRPDSGDAASRDATPLLLNRAHFYRERGSSWKPGSHCGLWPGPWLLGSHNCPSSGNAGS